MTTPAKQTGSANTWGPDLVAKLFGERDGNLAWLIEGIAK